MRFNNERTVKALKQQVASIGANLIVVWGTADDQVNLPSGADVGGIVGVTLYAGSATAGDPIEVVDSGYCDLVVLAAGTNIAKGDPISIQGATGKGKKAVPGGGSNTFLIGFACEAATADNVLICVRIERSIYQG